MFMGVYELSTSPAVLLYPMAIVGGENSDISFCLYFIHLGVDFVQSNLSISFNGPFKKF